MILSRWRVPQEEMAPQLKLHSQGLTPTQVAYHFYLNQVLEDDFE